MTGSGEEARIPVTLLTGFLGAGKTTVLNGLLGDPGMADAAVIVNEFGEIGLDHLLIRSAQDTVVLLDSGCLCCTIGNTLRETLGELWMGRVRGELPRFDRVLVETTGLAEPGPILASLTRDPFVTDHFRLDGVVTCVDAVHAPAQLDAQPEVLRQVAVADRLLLTKTDLVSAQATAAIEERLAGINPAASVLRVVRGAVPPSQVLGVGLGDMRGGAPAVAGWLAEERHAAVGHGHHAARHEADIRAHCFRVDHPVSWAGLAAWCELMAESHGEALLRVKGLLENLETGAPVVVHGVHTLFDRPLRLDAWPGGVRRGVLVVICRGLAEDDLRRTLRVLALPSGAGRPASFADVVV